MEYDEKTIEFIELYKLLSDEEKESVIAMMDMLKTEKE